MAEPDGDATQALGMLLKAAAHDLRDGGRRMGLYAAGLRELRDATGAVHTIEHRLLFELAVIATRTAGLGEQVEGLAVDLLERGQV